MRPYHCGSARLTESLCPKAEFLFFVAVMKKDEKKSDLSTATNRMPSPKHGRPSLGGE